jgi:hypothetical protein
MPIGLVSDELLERELRNLNGRSQDNAPVSQEVQIIQSPTKGRSEGDNNVPDSLRQIIGEEAVINGRQSALQIAGQFGISPSSASAYARGATSTTSYNSPSKSIISHINKSRQRAIGKAQKTMNGALNAITQEKLDYTDAKDLSAIAKDMSVIIKNLEPDRDVVPSNDQTKGPQFVIFAPQFRREESFDVITVNE